MTLLDLEYKPLYVTLWAGITETHFMAPISFMDLFLVHGMVNTTV